MLWPGETLLDADCTPDLFMHGTHMSFTFLAIAYRPHTTSSGAFPALVDRDTPLVGTMESALEWRGRSVVQGLSHSRIAEKKKWPIKGVPPAVNVVMRPKVILCSMHFGDRHWNLRRALGPSSKSKCSVLDGLLCVSLAEGHVLSGPGPKDGPLVRIRTTISSEVLEGSRAFY